MPRNPPRWWVMHRTGGAWKDLEVTDDAEDDYYVTLLRMRRSTFNRLLRVLAPHLEKQVTRWRKPLPPAQVLAYALHRWAHGDSNLNSSWTYGMGKTSGLRAGRDVSKAIIRCFGSVIGFGTFEERHRRMQKFTALGFPNCWGCIDGTHVFVDKPKKKDGDEFMGGHKRRFSIVAQSVFDTDLRILDLCYGFPGTVADGRVLRNSSLWRRGVSGELFTQDPEDSTRHLRPEIPGVPGGYLLADAGYPTLAWLVVPYGHSYVDPRTKIFDSRHKVVRSLVEQGIGLFKTRFQYFYRPHVCDLKIEGDEFWAACIVHNLLQAWGDLPEEYVPPPDAGSETQPPPSRAVAGELRVSEHVSPFNQGGRLWRRLEDAARRRVWGARGWIEKWMSAHQELQVLHRFLVKWGDDITVVLKDGGEKWRTEHNHSHYCARRWCKAVGSRLRQSRLNVCNCCNDVVDKLSQWRSEYMKFTKLINALKDRNDELQCELQKAREQHAYLETQLQDAIAAIAEARDQRDLAWHCYDEQFAEMTSDGPCDVDALAEDVHVVTLEDGGDGAAPSGDEGHVAKCTRCKSLQTKVEELGVKLEGMRWANTLLQEPPSFWNEVFED
ncbi:hypothetical protein CBR_g55629 [Chara braunii]|uniref:DDE Tnp4 domain-containing protein n=1 Tax=Chara braunii TaxID=69332 RepID=A0A388MD39_CHABU|nr:hypothetical protein CBR_g55629 [Chara braunii]|eukprot:GBG92478.1 hypothetical protein CBR_g55629 [Chara braunii]